MDDRKTKKQLIAELQELRAHVSGLEGNVKSKKEGQDGLKLEGVSIRQMIDIAGVIIMVISKDQIIRFINKTGCEVLGYPATEIIGKNWFDSFIPEDIREGVKIVF